MCGERLTVNFSILVGSGIGPAHLRAGALGRVDDLARRRIEDAMIERLEPDADILAVHGRSLSEVADGRVRGCAARITLHYSMMLGDDAGADGAAAFADGEAQLLFHRDRHDQLRPPSRCCRPASPSRCLPAACTTPVTSVVRK